jgi:hypothetical protein
MSWLLDDSSQGRLFATGEVNALTAATVAVSTGVDFGPTARAHRARLATRLSYERIVDEVLGRAGLRTRGEG